jgi:PAB1-binding protein PBP1
MSGPNVIQGRASVAERWIKLYRKIHNLFLKDEFIHKEDYLLTIKQLNARISAVEANTAAAIAANAAAINAAIVGHTHQAPQAPSGVIPTTPGIPNGSFGAPTPPTTPAVEHLTTVMETTDAGLQALGPPFSPIPTGLSPEVQTAGAQQAADIGT